MKKDNKSRKVSLAAAVVINLAMLGIFKYAGFGAEMLDRLPFLSVSVPNIALPIGISFYTFQAMSYVIDAYKNPAYIQKNLFKRNAQMKTKCSQDPDQIFFIEGIAFS